MSKCNRPILFVFVSILCVGISSCATPLPGHDSVNIPEDFFGMVHADRTGTDEEKQLLDEMGVIWVLNTFNWNKIEGTRGEFDFSGTDEFVDRANAEDRKIVAVLAFTTPWLYPEGKGKRYISPENLPFFLNYVEETVGRYKDRIDAWIIWNEPNSSRFWKGPKKDFFELSKQAALKIRETDPDAYILGGAYMWIPKQFIIDMHKAGAMENLDGIAIHPYHLNPRESIKIYDTFLKILSKINFTGSVWITEIGYPTAGAYPTKVSLKEQSSYVIKMLTGAAIRGPSVLLWYQLLDTYNLGEVPPHESNDSERFFGLVYPDYQRKSGAYAYGLCARYLAGSRYISEYPEREKIPSNIVSFCFVDGKSGDNTLILWNDRKQTQKINVSLSGPALLHDISTGENIPLSSPIVLNVGNEPLFITWQGEAMPRLSR